MRKKGKDKNEDIVKLKGDKFEVEDIVKIKDDKFENDYLKDTLNLKDSNIRANKRRERANVQKRVEKFLKNYKPKTIEEAVDVELKHGKVAVRIDSKTTIFVNPEKCIKNKNGQWELKAKNPALNPFDMPLNLLRSKKHIAKIDRSIFN